MLKEVGASGQISLGKKYAGQLFEVETQIETTRAWVQAHAADIDRYNAWASLREPYSQRVRRWRARTDGAL